MAIFCKETLHKILCHSWYNWPWCFIKTRLSLQHRPKYTRLCASPKWPTTTKENIGYNTNAPDISLYTIWPMKNLWRNIVSTSNNVIQPFIYKSKYQSAMTIRILIKMVSNGYMINPLFSPGLTKSESPKSMALSCPLSSFVVNKKFCKKLNDKQPVQSPTLLYANKS